MLTRVVTPEERWKQRRGRVGRVLLDEDQYYFYVQSRDATWTAQKLIESRDWADCMSSMAANNIDMSELLYSPPPPPMMVLF